MADDWVFDSALVAGSCPATQAIRAGSPPAERGEAWLADARGHDLAIMASCRPYGFKCRGLSIVCISPCGCRYRRGNRDPDPRQYPRSLTGSEPGRQKAVVNFACHGEAIEVGWRQVQPNVVGKAIRRGVRIAFGRRDDAVMVSVHAGNFRGVSIEQPSLQILHVWFERGWPCVNVQKDFIGQPTRNTTLTEFPLRVHGAVELVGITRKIGVIPDRLRIIADPTRPRPRND